MRGGSCTERRGVVVSMTGGVKGAERDRKYRAFFFFLFCISMVSLFIVQETAWRTSYGVNKTVNNHRTRFTLSWENSNSPNSEHTPSPNST